MHIVPALSVSRDADRGPEPTIKVGFGPRNFDPKLSESLLNNPSPLNNPVRFGVAEPTGPGNPVRWDQCPGGLASGDATDASGAEPSSAAVGRIEASKEWLRI
jgi:hypothetical protein